MHGILRRIQSSLSAILPKSGSDRPTISSYGQEESNLSIEEMQSVMEWLFLSLMNAGYFSRSHLVWLQPEGSVKLNRQLQDLHRQGEPVLAYRCGARTSTPPAGFYWRLMLEHPSLRIYQLEVKQDD
jgi:hypothetical protein